MQPSLERKSVFAQLGSQVREPLSNIENLTSTFKLLEKLARRFMPLVTWCPISIDTGVLSKKYVAVKGSSIATRPKHYFASCGEDVPTCKPCPAPSGPSSAVLVKVSVIFLLQNWTWFAIASGAIIALSSFC